MPPVVEVEFLAEPAFGNAIAIHRAVAAREASRVEGKRGKPLYGGPEKSRKRVEKIKET